jgi:hypothetical protein
MCFSATASFMSATILASTGAIALAFIRDPRQRWFAALPIIFGAQQAAEGVIWLTLQQKNEPSPLHFSAVVSFIFIAFVVWPLWMPWSVRQMEPAKKRRLWLRACQTAGVLYAVVALYVIATAHPHSEIVGRCLNYTFENDSSPAFPPNLHAFFYFASTVIPFFLSSARWVRNTGILIMIGLVTTMAVWKFAVTSVWCFFAAMASLYICGHLYLQRQAWRSVKIATAADGAS